MSIDVNRKKCFLNLRSSNGFTLVELVIGLVVLSIVAISFLSLFTSLVRSALVAKRKAVASSIATNQIEYIKSLPYDSLAVSGGSIYATNPIPSSTTQKIDGYTYTVTTSINYVDDAFDGCGPYPNQAIKQLLCRNYPPPASQTATDTNPADYKIVNVSVKGTGNNILANVDTQIAARVAETSSTTGALVVNVFDENSNPVQGATITVTDSTLTPAVNLSDTSDSNGIAIFYNLPPDTNNFDYVINGAKSGYSSLTTITPTTLTPTYSSQKIFSQSSSFVSLILKNQGPNSLVLESKNTSGVALSGMKVNVKGGYKKYSSATDTSYYFDTLSPSDTRPTTDSNGLASLSNLVPGPYYICGDTGTTSCTIGATTYYLIAAVPYSGTSTYQPINVPAYLTSSPPSPTYNYSGNDFYQKTRLIFSTNSSFPRINRLSDHELSLSTDNKSSFPLQISGNNLVCSSSAASCSTQVKIIQGSNIFSGSCTGNSSPATTINCTFNLTGIVAGSTQLQITYNGNTYTSPSDMSLGSINVVP